MYDAAPVETSKIPHFGFQGVHLQSLKTESKAVFKFAFFNNFSLSLSLSLSLYLPLSLLPSLSLSLSLSLTTISHFSEVRNLQKNIKIHTRCVPNIFKLSLKLTP